MRKSQLINKFKLLLVSALMLVSFSSISQALTQNDFAYAADLRTTTGTPFYELEIPELVYKNISRNDLGDMRVLNGSGQVVPHGLRNIEPEVVSHVSEGEVPYFPLYLKQGDSNGDLHLNIKRNASGDVLDIKSSGSVAQSGERLSGYLVDLREWDKPVDTIKLSWETADNKSFIRKLKISVSEDLSNWKVITEEKSLVNLLYQTHQLIEDRIKLSSGRIKYLRITFTDDKPGLEITRVDVISTRASQQYKKNWLNTDVVINEGAGAPAGEYLFQHPLKSSLSELRVKLPENNTVVNVKILSRGSEDKPWQYRGAKLLYRLSVDGVNIQQQEVSLNASSDIFWKLVINQQGGGIGEGLPIIELAWKPQQLVFVARGEAPYTLVWGSVRVPAVTQDAKQILIGVNQENTNSMLGSAYWLAETVRTVNLLSLTEADKPLNWRQWLLWAVLIFAAIILIWMAVRLMSKMAD